MNVWRRLKILVRGHWNDQPVDVTRWGDESHDGQVREMRMHVGHALDTATDEEVLKGKVWLETVRNTEGALFTSSETRYEARWLCREDLGAGAAPVLPTCTGISDRNAKKDSLVRIAIETGTLSGHWERQSTARYTARKTNYNAFANPTRIEEYGEVTFPGGHTLGQEWTFADLNVAVGNDEQ